jgi:hypothetical protein
MTTSPGSSGPAETRSTAKPARRDLVSMTRPSVCAWCGGAICLGSSRAAGSCLGLKEPVDAGRLALARLIATLCLAYSKGEG